MLWSSDIFYLCSVVMKQHRLGTTLMWGFSIIWFYLVSIIMIFLGPWWLFKAVGMWEPQKFILFLSAEEQEASLWEPSLVHIRAHSQVWRFKLALLLCDDCGKHSHQAAAYYHTGLPRNWFSSTHQLPLLCLHSAILSLILCWEGESKWRKGPNLCWRVICITLTFTVGPATHYKLNYTDFM